jgi:hypothetical protein
MKDNPVGVAQAKSGRRTNWGCFSAKSAALAVALATCMTAALACSATTEEPDEELGVSGERDETATDSGRANQDVDGTVTDGATAATPAFLLGTRVWDDTSTTSYFHVVPSLEGDVSVDERRALEVPGAAKLYAIEGVGWFAIGGGETPTITRYTLDDAGELNEAETVSLQSYGVESLWDTLYVVSPTKMYYPDRDGQRLIIIDPRAMEITGEVDLGETGREGFLSLYSYSHFTRGAEILFSVAWIDWSETDSILGETGLVVLDTETDTVSRFDVDARCGGVTTPVELSSGDVYFVSSALAAAAHRLERLPTAPCALRVPAGRDAFDLGYLESLEELTDYAIVGEPIPAGGDAVFLRAFDTELGSVSDGALTWELTSQLAWRWSRWTPSIGEVLPVDSLPPSTSDVTWFRVDGKVYGTETTSDYSETTLIELSAEGGPRRALTAPGFLHGVAKVR